MPQKIFKKTIAKKEILHLIKSIAKAFQVSIFLEDGSEPSSSCIAKATVDAQQKSSCYPIRVGENHLGWVSCTATDVTDNSTELSRLEAQTIAIAEMVSYLLKQEIEKKSLAQELLEKYQEIDLFQDISAQIAASLNMQEIAQLVLEKTSELIGSTSGAILLLNADTGQLERLATFGAPWQEASSLRLGKVVFRRVAQSGRGEILNQVPADLMPQKANSSPCALIYAPLKTKEQVIGAIALSQSDATPYTTNDLKLLLISASQAAVALEKAMLYQQRCADAIAAQSQAERLQQALQELQQAQARLVQSEKLSSLGQLVAGVAHEINNPVNFLSGNLTPAVEYTNDLLEVVDLYQQHYPELIDEIQARLEEIDLDFLKRDLPRLLSSMRIGVDRIRQTVSSLRNFSRMDQSSMTPVDIHEGIDSTLMILHHRLKPSGNKPPILVVKEYGELPPVECYAGQLNQVFMNVFSNAIDALEEAVVAGCWALPNVVKPTSDATQTSGPTIWIYTTWVGEHVTIGIRDNGPGIPEPVRVKLFEPFFTTKPVGKGTGLGLSISHQIIVQQHRGELECISRLGEGTEFRIQVPVSHSQVSQISC